MQKKATLMKNTKITKRRRKKNDWLMTNDSYALLAGRGTAGAAVARRQLTTELTVTAGACVHVG